MLIFGEKDDIIILKNSNKISWESINVQSDSDVKNDTTEIELTSTQRDAVCCENNRVAVVAGPGSGKTRVLTERIAWLINEKKFHLKRFLH